MTRVPDDAGTAASLPYARLADEVEALLLDPHVRTPARLVMPLPGGGSLFVMPAHDARTAIVKSISYTPANAGTPRPAIQGDVLVFDVATGARVRLLDGPTVTARRTAAVSLLAARRLAPDPAGRLLIVGAGVQGRAHLEAFAAGLGTRRAFIVSGRRESAEALAAHAATLGVEAAAAAADDAGAAQAECSLVVTCTPASQVVLRGPLREDAFVAAVGAFTPGMIELDGDLCRALAKRGRIVVDTADAVHEAGDLLQAGVDAGACPTLGDVVRGAPWTPDGPVLFKSCGWAGWDLAAARLARGS